MPNTAVKPLYAESTRLETVREDRELPVKRERLHRKMQAFFVYVNGQRSLGPVGAARRAARLVADCLCVGRGAGLAPPTVYAVSKSICKN